MNEIIISKKLWFDVEKRYNTTEMAVARAAMGCGLM